MADISGFNVGGQYVSPELYGIYEKQTHTGKVSGLLVKQNTTPNMTVLVEPGIALLDKGSFSSVVAGVKSNTSLTIATANPSNPRIDAIVVYEDIAVTMPSVEPYSVDASNGRFKMVVVAGTPGAVPTAPSDPTIQSTIGAGNTSWTRLATVRVEAGTTTIVNSKIDNTIRSSLGSLLAPGQVTADKIDFTSVIAAEQAWQTLAHATGAVTTPLGYYKDSLGIVHLRGQLNMSGTDVVFATLPVGYRPEQYKEYATASAGQFGIISIATDGKLTKLIGNSGNIDLDMITFRAA